MKYKLTKAEFDALTTEQKAMYKLKGNDYIFQLEGMPDVDALQTSVTALEGKNAELITEKQKAKKLADDAEAARVLAEAEAKAKTGDISALNAEWQKKVDAAEKKTRDQEREFIGTITELTAGSTSTSIAAELAVEGSAGVLEPHIKSRLKTEYKDGKANIIVLGKDGKPSAMTIAELKQEIIDDKQFAPVISASKASGSGGDQGTGSALSTKLKSTNLGGTRAERVAALKKQFPDLRD